MISRRLFELVTADRTSISPYVWRSKYALAMKGLAYETCEVGFRDVCEIGNGQFTTVPVLADGERWVADSWAIAAHLDAAYPDLPPLLSSAAEQALARFFETWFAVEIISRLFRMCVFDIYNRLQEGDRAYFRESREQRLGHSLEIAHAERDCHLPSLSERLEPVRLVLRQSPFLGGAAPAYADFIAIGGFIWAGSMATVALLAPDDPVLDWLDRCLALYGGVGDGLLLPGLHRGRLQASAAC